MSAVISGHSPGNWRAEPPDQRISGPGPPLCPGGSRLFSPVVFLSGKRRLLLRASRNTGSDRIWLFVMWITRNPFSSAGTEMESGLCPRRTGGWVGSCVACAPPHRLCRRVLFTAPPFLSRGISLCTSAAGRTPQPDVADGGGWTCEVRGMHTRTLTCVLSRGTGASLLSVPPLPRCPFTCSSRSTERGGAGGGLGYDSGSGGTSGPIAVPAPRDTSHARRTPTPHTQYPRGTLPEVGRGGSG